MVLARITGVPTYRILLRHLLPNVVNTLIVLGTLQLGIAIIAAASLSFLGLGVPPPKPDWGAMLAEGRNYTATAWWGGDDAGHRHCPNGALDQLAG